VLFVPFVTEPLFELSFQLVHRHGVDVTKGMDLLNLLLRDLAKQALEQALEVLGAECLRHRLLRLALELRLELPTHLHRQRGFAEPSESHDGEHLELLVTVTLIIQLLDLVG